MAGESSEAAEINAEMLRAGAREVQNLFDDAGDATARGLARSVYEAMTEQTPPRSAAETLWDIPFDPNGPVFGPHVPINASARAREQALRKASDDMLQAAAARIAELDAANARLNAYIGKITDDNTALAAKIERLEDERDGWIDVPADVRRKAARRDPPAVGRAPLPRKAMR